MMDLIGQGEQFHRQGDICGDSDGAISSYSRLHRAMDDGMISYDAARTLVDVLAPSPNLATCMEHIHGLAGSDEVSLLPHTGTNPTDAILLLGRHILWTVQMGHHDLVGIEGFGSGRHNWYQLEIHLGDAWSQFATEQGSDKHACRYIARSELNGDLQLGYFDRHSPSSRPWHFAPRARLLAEQVNWLRELMDRGAKDVAYQADRRCIYGTAWRSYQALRKMVSCDATRQAIRTKLDIRVWEDTVTSYFAEYQRTFGSLGIFEEQEVSRYELQRACSHIRSELHPSSGFNKGVPRLRLDEEDKLHIELYGRVPSSESPAPRMLHSVEIDLARLSDPGLFAEVALRSILLTREQELETDGKHFTLVGNPYRLWELIYRATQS